MQNNSVIGLDLAKTSFAVVELGVGGDVKHRKTFGGKPDSGRA
ncbi:hypothetical protein SAMN05216203_1039 [Marinobacter daqiaonensis]|uniref:Transposase n=1 Tax=Marinobacter daqiaonensis TaxID=650891 RepID=A0A1I6HAG2_9GAMM|nr:hypothetical protein [Marinobacter daqiaonensis]SFR51368.1 hypothetical protein SAMN05216203_1039 [Marinobacter daqiaonensis]